MCEYVGALSPDGAEPGAAPWQIELAKQQQALAVANSIRARRRPLPTRHAPPQALASVLRTCPCDGAAVVATLADFMSDSQSRCSRKPTAQQAAQFSHQHRHSPIVTLPPRACLLFTPCSPRTLTAPCTQARGAAERARMGDQRGTEPERGRRRARCDGRGRVASDRTHGRVLPGAAAVAAAGRLQVAGGRARPAAPAALPLLGRQPGRGYAATAVACAAVCSPPRGRRASGGGAT